MGLEAVSAELLKLITCCTVVDTSYAEPTEPGSLV